MRTLADILYDVQQRIEDLPAYLDQDVQEDIQDLVKEAYTIGREEGVDIGRAITEKYGRPLFE